MAKKIRIIPELDDSKILKQLRNLGNRREKIKVDVDSGNVRNANQQMQQLVTTTANSNTTFKKLKNTISNTFSSGRITMTTFLTVLHEISKAGKEAKKTIQDIDKAITDLSIATNMSREATAGLVKEYNSYAKELKSTTTQITSAANDFLRAGKSMSETKKLIEDSVMLSKLGQLETPEATEDLLATMNGFEMSVEEVGSALDAMVAIDMKAATSAGDIATALKYSASSADMAGLSFNKLASMIGTVQDKTQQSAETVGTFMNTLLSRYRNVKIGQFVSDDGEDLSEVETILEDLDIKLRDSKQEFRNFELVIDEVAMKWDSYSSVQQAAIAKAFSGTRQQNRFIALMEGYGKVPELTEVAANSAGTALEKFNNSYKDSLEAKQNDLQASFESMVINSDMDEVYSGILDATKALIDFINHTNALKGVMTGLTLSAGIKGFLTLRTAINESYIAMNQFSNALKIVKQTNISTDDWNRLLLLTKNLSDSQMKMVLSSNALEIEQKKLLLVNAGLAEEEALLKLQTYGLTTAQTGLTVATTSLGNALKGMRAYMAANPILVFTMAISGLTMCYQSYNQKLEETRQKNIEASETAIDHANNLKDLYNEYSRLSAIQGRSSAEEEEFKTVVEDVTKALGDKAKVLEGLTAGTNEYADALANATKEELKSASANATIGRKSAEEELQADIWSEWKGSKVSVDSNSTGKTLSEEAQRAVDIVSDSLRDFETVNKTWNNLSWDITSDSPEKALEYYNSLLEAREELVLASENDEALLDTEIYKDMNTAISAMEDSLDSYISKRYEEEKLIYMATNGIPQTTEEYKAMQDSLMATASASVDLQDSFKSLLMADFSSLANEIEGVSEAQSELEDSLPDGGELVSTISTSVKQIATQLEPQFAKLGEAYNDIFTEGGFTLDNVDNTMLENLRKSFAEIEKEIGVVFDSSKIEDFFSALNNNDPSKVQSAFNDLATAYLYSTDTLDNLNEATADSITKQLEELGVINAKEIVYDTLAVKTQALALQEQFLAENGYALADATSTKVSGFLNEAGASEVARQYLFQLVATEQIFNNQDLNAKQKIDELQKLATAYGQTAIAAKIANMEKASVDGHVSIDYDKELASLQAHINEGINNVKVDFSGIQTNASSAGKSHAEEYLDGLKDKLSDLDNVLGYISDTIQNQIDLYGEQKNIAVDTLQAEKQAAEDALQAQKDLVQEKIDGLQDEIDAIKTAREERELQISAQQKLYDLNKKMNQKVELVYQGGQMVYREDISGMRQAKEEYDKSQEDIKIFNLEKEISGLEDVLDSLDKQIEESNKYYDGLIKQTEAYYDNLIKGLEEYKSRWDEIGEIEEQAKIQVALKNLGIETTDILNMSEEAFNTFKQQYLNILTEMYAGETDMISAINSVADGIDLSALEVGLATTKDSIQALNDTDYTTASNGLNNIASSVGEIATNSKGVSEDINSINTALDTLSDSTKLEGIKLAFNELLGVIKNIATELGTTTENMQATGGLIGAIQALNEAQISTGLLSQFTELESAIDAVTTAISGGGDSKGQNLPQGGAPTKQGSITPSGSPDSGNGGGLTQALEEQVEKAKELLPEEIALFSGDEDSLLSAVTKVTTAIAGGGDSEGGEKKENKTGEGEVDTSHLMGALEAQYKLAEEKIPTETGYFNDLATAIESCVEQLKAMAEALANMPSATISFGGGASGGAGVNGTAHYEGTANVRGNWGVRDSGRSLVGELGQELVVRGSKFFTVGDNGAEFVDLQRGDIVFNHKQTESLLKNGYVTGRGNAYANGTFSAIRDDIIIQKPTNLPPYLRELQEGDRMFDIMKKIEAHGGLLASGLITPVNSIQKNTEAMIRNISNVNTNNVANNQTINMTVNCPGITSKEVANQVKAELNHAFSGMSLDALQRAHITR